MMGVALHVCYMQVDVYLFHSALLILNAQSTSILCR